MNAALPINPTIIRIMRVLRIARGILIPASSLSANVSIRAHTDTLGTLIHSIMSMVMYHRRNADCDSYCVYISTVLKLLKLATGMRALLDTVMQALPQVHIFFHHI